MNTLLLKQISILSIFLGLALGVLTLIPFIGTLAFWGLMCLSAVFIILFMQKIELLDIKTPQESAIIGSIIGFVSFIGFSTSYIPLVIIIGKLFQLYTNYGIYAALSKAGFGMIILLVIFIGVLSATINAFSGFLTYFGLDVYKQLKKNDEQFKLR